MRLSDVGGALGIPLAALLLAVGASPAEPGTNLVTNPGFEVLEMGQPTNWRFDRLDTGAWGVSDDAHVGEHCLYSQLTEGSSGSWWQDGIPVEPSTTYDVAIWVRVDRPASLRAVSLGVTFDTHSAPHHTEVLTPGKWHRISYTVRSWPGDRSARVRLLVGRDWDGRAWFDDASLRVSEVDWMDRFPKTSLAGLEFEPNHPCVLFNATEISALRRAIRAEPWAREAYAGLLDQAGRYLAERPFRLPDLDFGKVGPGHGYMRGEAGHSKALGLAYQLSQNREFAEAARERLLAYAEEFPEGNMCRSGYGYVTGYALHDVAIAYDLVHDSPALSDEDRGIIESMLREGFRGMSRHRDVMSINNRGAVCMGAMSAIAFCLQDPDLVEWTLNGPHGFNYHMQEGVGDDGIWTEGISYGNMALGNALTWNCGYLSVAEAAHHAGIDLYSHPRLRRLLEAPLEYCFPDFSLPANGHCFYSATLLGQQESRRYIKPWLRTRDLRYAWLISEGLKIDNWLPLGGHAADLFLLAGKDQADFPAADSPKLSSTLFSHVGHAMLRSGQGEDEICVFFDYGPFGSHGNPDKMSMSLYALGNLLSPDGITGYWWPETFLYECQTIGHNTVVVDEKTQFPTADGELNVWLPSGRLQLVDAQDSQANLGVTMRRTLALGEGYVVDLFALESDQEHRYDWAYHNFGKLTVDAQLQPRAGTLGIRDGYQYITSPSRGDVYDTWRAEWDIGEMNLIWNASFEFQTGPVWKVVGWRIPASRWRPYVFADPEVHRNGKQSLRIDLPQDGKEFVYLLATYRPTRFVAGKEYLVEGYVRTQDEPPPQSEIGIWVGDRLVCSAPTPQREATTKEWTKISGVYEASADHRDLVRIGVRNAPGATVWFDDICVRIRDEDPRALRLTMLGSVGTEVISSEGEGLRPFDQPLVVARRKTKATVFASVMEPYHGRPVVRALRSMSPEPREGQAGVVVETDDSIDRFVVSYSTGPKSYPHLQLEGMVGAASVARETQELRYLCLGRGTRVEAGAWSLETEQPGTVYLEEGDGVYVLRTSGTHENRVTVAGPNVTRDWTVSELNADGRGARPVASTFEGGSVSFDIRDGQTYRLGRTPR